MLVNKLVVIGFGLIGASLAAAIKQANQCREVIAIARSEFTRDNAVKLKLADRAFDSIESVPDTLGKNDIIVVAVPTLSTETIFKQLAKSVGPDVTITDCASVKGSIYQAAINAWGEFPSQLVLGHPIAGSEQSGVTAANPKLFQQHKVILTPVAVEQAERIKQVTALWQASGADVVTMPIDEHDVVLAATSHLPHVIAYSLVDTLANDEEHENIFRYAAGGFKDFTRIASSDPTMWKDIMLANKDSILRALTLFGNNLNQLRSAIEAGDDEQLHQIFTRAKTARDDFLKKQIKQ